MWPNNYCSLIVQYTEGLLTSLWEDISEINWVYNKLKILECLDSKENLSLVFNSSVVFKVYRD